MSHPATMQDFEILKKDMPLPLNTAEACPRGKTAEI